MNGSAGPPSLGNQDRWIRLWNVYGELTVMQVRDEAFPAEYHVPVLRAVSEDGHVGYPVATPSIRRYVLESSSDRTAEYREALDP